MTTVLSCPRCDRALATTDGAAISIGAVVIRHRCTLCCPCGGYVRWTPPRRPSSPDDRSTVDITQASVVQSQ